MEEHQRQHIISNLTELTHLTSCNATCIASLRHKGVFSERDVAELSYMPNVFIKSDRFYRILLTKKGSYPHLITALEESCQTGALQILKKLEKEEVVSLGKEWMDESKAGSSRYKNDKRRPGILFDVMAPVYNFTGRENEVLKIHNLLQENYSNPAGMSKIVTVVGLGGIGKTELARKYVHEYGKEFYDGNVIWMSAQTEEVLTESFIRLATDYLNVSLTNVDKKALDIGTIVDRVYAHFTDKKVLFVFDNAECFAQLQKFIPSSSCSPYILTTSRNHERRFPAHFLQLAGMTETEAILFVKRSLQIENNDDKDVLRLVNRLESNTLALSQAISFIKQRRCVLNFSVNQYLKIFEETSKKPLAEVESYKQTIVSTLSITTEQISSDKENGNCAMKILNTICYFRPDKIPIRMFANLTDYNDYQKALDLLVKYSMVSIEDKKKTISVSRLVQQITTIQLSNNRQDVPVLKTTLQLVSSAITSDSNENIVYHALSAYKFAASSKLSIEFKHIPWNILSVLNSYTRYEEAIAVGKELEPLLGRLLSQDDPDVIRFKLALADATFILQENLEEKLKGLEKLLEQVVNNKDNSFDEHDRLRVETLVANYLKKLGRFQEALDLSRSTIERHKSLYGLNNWLTISNVINITSCIWKLGAIASPSSLSVDDNSLKQQATNEELSTAISSLKVAHQTSLELIGKDVNWSSTMFSVADCLEDIGDTEYATKVLNDVIQRTTESSDRRFFRIAINSMNLLIFLAHTKKSEGKNDQAVTIVRNVQAVLNKFKSKNDNETLGGRVLLINELEAALQTLIGDGRKVLDPEEIQRNYIFQNLRELVESTYVGHEHLASLMGSGVFTMEDVETLDSIHDVRDKSLRFYELIVTRPGFFTALKKFLLGNALKILERLDKDGEADGPAGSSTNGKFREHSEVNKQSHFIRQNFLALVKNTNVNTTFLTLLEANGVLSKDDLARLHSKQHKFEKAKFFYHLIMQKLNFFRHLITALTETNQIEALKILKSMDKEEDLEVVGQTGTNTPSAADINPQGESEPRANTPKSIRFDVKDPVPYFTGRAEEIQKLHQKLQQNWLKMVTVTGLGGIGKTELVRSYIQQYEDEYDNNVVWINAFTSETMMNCFRRLAIDHLKLQNLKETKDYIDGVYKYFQGRRSLFVLDNAGDICKVEKIMLFHPHYQPYLLITSRDKDWSMDTLKLNEMEQREATDFVKKELKSHDDDDRETGSIIQLVNRLQCFPLALSQAIFYIKMQKISIREYLEKLEEDTETVLYSKISPSECNEYGKSTLTTWKATTHNISLIENLGQKAFWMLNTISYLQPTKIPIKILVSSKNERARYENKKALRLLAKYSMVDIQLEKETICVHRLVQEVYRIQLRENKKEEVNVLGMALKTLSENMDIDTCNHACSVFNYSAPYKTLVEEFKGIAIQILGTFYPNKINQHTLNLATELRKVLQENVPAEDVDLLRFEARVADVEFELGAFENGLKTLEKIVPFYVENEAGSFSQTEIIQVRQQFALFLKQLGKQTESLSLQLQLFQKLKSLRDVNDFDTIKALVDITNCLYELGYFEEEPPVNQQYLQLLRMVYNVTNPQTINSIFKTAYEANKHLVGSAANYANLFFGVAECFHKLGEKDIAESIAREIYELGKDSKDFDSQNNSMICLNFLANMKKEEGKNQEALELYQEAHTMLENTIGNDNLHTLTIKVNALITQGELGQTEAALEGLQGVLRKMQENYPGTHETLHVELNVASLLHKTGKYNDSLDLLVGIKEKLQKKFPQLETLIAEVNAGIEKVQNTVPLTSPTEKA